MNFNAPLLHSGSTNLKHRDALSITIGIVTLSRPMERLRLLFQSIKVACEILQREIPSASVSIYLKCSNRLPRLDFPFDFIDNCFDNIGFGASHNRLMQECFSNSESDMYFCLNDDTIVDPYCLLEAHEFARSNAFNVLFEAIQTPLEHPKPYDPLSGITPWCSGAAMFITRSIFMQTGGFDENMFMYCEDVDLSWRVRCYGGSCRLLPSARVAHEVSLGGAKPREIRRQMLESARYLGEKWSAPEFVRAIETILVEEGFYPDPIYLRAVRIANRFPPDLDIMEFRQLLSFCIPRWR